MASTPSITELSTKDSLPTMQPITEEPKAHCFRQWTAHDDPSPSRFQKIVAEIVGTYILVFVGCGSALVNNIQSLTMVGIGLAWGLALMAMIYAVGHVSGAHFNPAVTIAFAAIRKLPWKQVPTYVLAQLLGATLASLVLKGLYSEQENIKPTVTQYADTTSHLEAIIWEIIVTFILMFNISAVASDHRACKDFAGLVIGVTVMFNAFVAGPITGASMNPARSIGPAVVSGVYKNLWVYIVAPIIGAMGGAIAYNVLRVPVPAEKPEETKSIYNQFYTPEDP